MSRTGRARFRVASPVVVRDIIARGVLGPDPGVSRVDSDVTMVGSVTLLPHQHDAIVRLRAILRELHVALLADDVGLGKTFVALAMSREYPETLVIAPAALLPMWREAILRTGNASARLESLHRYSRPNPPRPPVRNALIIIDEAHHLRTPATRRYRSVAHAVSGRDLLLLSATPVHNSPHDLRALLALAIGAGAERLDDALLSRVVVRRTRMQSLPVVREQPPQRMPHDTSVLDAILALPAPLPAQDGTVAGALVRLGLLRAWCSSDSALTHILRRRLLRGEALRHALEGGRHPTNVELRAWLVGEHEVQLAFPQLMAGHAPETGPLLEVLNRHLEAVAALLQRHLETARGDAARADAIREITRTHPDKPIIAFSQYAETVQAVGRALSDIAGVGVLTGRRARIASGSISRQEALASFAPVAQGRPPPPAHERIRLLLTTDLLSEGVNLQDAGVVVHLDLPWTDALRRQRVGRCARVGSPHGEVVVYRFEPPQGADSVMRLHARLERKAGWARRFVGAVQDEGAGGRRTSAADAATKLRDVLQSWISEDMKASAFRCSRSRIADGTTPVISAVNSPLVGFVALVTDSVRSQVLVGGCERKQDGGTRLALSTSPRRLLALLCEADHSRSSRTIAHREWARARLALRRWIRRRALSAELGDAERASTGVHRRVHDALTGGINGLSTTQRILYATAYRDALEMLERSRGAAVELALQEWLSTRAQSSFAAWLQEWRQWPVLAVAASGSHGDLLPGHAPRFKVVAILLFRRP